MKISKQNSVAKKIVFSCLIVVGVLAVSYLVYYLINYTFNKDYRKYLLSSSYEAGTEFKALSDSDAPAGLPEGYVLAAKSDKLRLYYNTETTEVAVYDEGRKELTFSNPQDLTGEDYDNNTYMWMMKSQLIVHYYESTGSSMIKDMDSYSYSTNIDLSESEDAEPQYKVEAITNGIRVIYTLGNLSSQSSVPDYISEDTFEDLKTRFKDAGEKESTLTGVYQKSKSVDGFYQLNNGVKKGQRKRLEEVFEKVGWTMEDFEREMEASGVDYDVPISFTIPLEYSLDGDKLKVNIVTNHIVETGGAALTSIDVLPYFGAEYHTVSGKGYSAYTYEIDEYATEAVAYEVETDKIKVNYSGGQASATFDNEIAEDFSYCDFKLYDAEAYEAYDPEAEDSVEPDILTQWSSYNESDEVDLDLDKDYILEFQGYKNGGSGKRETETFKFKVHSKVSPNEGYYLVPNGSGSVIKLNSPNCDGPSDYKQTIYGTDDVLVDNELRTAETISAKLPVYGWSTADKDILVILSRGESLADVRVMTANEISCKASDSLCNYNTAYCSYTLRAVNSVQISTTDIFTVWNKDLFDVQITQEYCFLQPENAGYAGMANYYRDYLISKGDLVKSEETNASNIGLYLDLIGAVRGDTTFLGFTTESVIPLTTFKQAESIADSFFSNGIRNLIVNYQGWMNGGYYHDTVDDIKVIRKLGGKNGFENLASHIESGGGKLYGDMAITEVSYGAKDFQYNLESSRLYGSGYVAAYGKTSPTTYSNSASLGYRANLYDILSPKYYEKYVDGALKDMKKIDVNGISFRDLGTSLYSDMKKTDVINREHTKEITEAMLKKTIDADKNIMLNSALGYALAYADDIINAPIGDNNYVYVDHEVPFYEMVIHGYINYAGMPINLSADTSTENNILECIEYGASPHFTLTYEQATEMKYTALNNLYATNYVNWVDEACDIYEEVNSALSAVTSASVINHEILDDNNSVKKVSYDNGVVIYVNYSEEQFSSDGVTLEPKSYMVVQ